MEGDDEAGHVCVQEKFPPFPDGGGIRSDVGRRSGAGGECGFGVEFCGPLDGAGDAGSWIDISQQQSKPLSDFQPEDFDAVISLCGCGVSLPPEWLTRDYFADWQLEDPEGGELDTFRRVREQVKERVVQWLDTLAA
jgi:glutathione/glutaredoxin type arsenate reductase